MYHVISTDDVRGSFSFQKLSADQEIKRKKRERGKKGWKKGGRDGSVGISKAWKMEKGSDNTELG